MNSSRHDKKVEIKENAFPLSKQNLILMAVAGIMIITGFMLMLGSESTEQFNPDIFSTRRLVIGPTIAFLGYLFMAFALMFHRHKDKSK